MDKNLVLKGAFRKLGIRPRRTEKRGAVEMSPEEGNALKKPEPKEGNSG